MQQRSSRASTGLPLIRFSVKVERVRDAAEVHQVLHRTASHQVQGEGGEGERCSRGPPGPPQCGPVWSRSSTGLPLIRFRVKVKRWLKS